MEKKVTAETYFAAALAEEEGIRIDEKNISLVFTDKQRAYIRNTLKYRRHLLEKYLNWAANFDPNNPPQSDVNDPHYVEYITTQKRLSARNLLQ